MRILLIADIHGNRAALEAIDEKFDACLCMGDVVEYGPNPKACIRWVKEHAKATVRGNHDHGCVQDVDVYGETGFRYLTMATRKPTLNQLSRCDRRFLAELPLTQLLTLDGKRFLLVHATPRDPLEEYTPSDPEMWKERLAGIKADFVCVGHTHQQFVLNAGRSTIINPGSVGLPRDGEPKCKYAIVENGEVQLKQIDYPIEETVKEVRASNFPEKAKQMLTQVYRAGRYIPVNAKVAG